MSEWFKEPVLKTGDGAIRHGFESHSLRQKKGTLRRAFFLAERMGFERTARAEPGKIPGKLWAERHMP